MSEHIHPLVLATIESERARRELELERLKSAREACTTASPGGQSRAMALGKKIREVESIVRGWRLAVATLAADLHEMTEVAEGATTSLESLRAMLGPQGADRVVGTRTRINKRLRCLRCTDVVRKSLPRVDLIEVTSEDLSDGGMCADCGADVLVDPQQPRPPKGPWYTQ